MDCSPTRLLHPWDFPGKNTGVGCCFLLQEIFLTQGLYLGLLHCRQTLYCLSHREVHQIIHAARICAVVCDLSWNCLRKFNSKKRGDISCWKECRIEGIGWFFFFIFFFPMWKVWTYLNAGTWLGSNKGNATKAEESYLILLFKISGDRVE